MIYEQLSDEEAYLYALFQDESGIDQAEFCFVDETSDNGLFRAWPIQKFWWTDPSPLNLSMGSRSVGKSLSLRFRAFAFPFVLPGEEMVVTAPEGGHLDAVMDNVETLFTNNRIAEGMLANDNRGRIKHRPWMINFASGGRILGKIPKHDGSGMRGLHPIWLEQDESSFYPETGWTEVIETVKIQHPKARWRCIAKNSMVLTKRGQVPIQEVIKGDYVWTHEQCWGEVTDWIHNGFMETLYTVLENGIELCTTSNHRFYQGDDEWAEARGLEFVIDQYGIPLTVVDQFEGMLEEVYDLTVKDYNSFTVDGIIVHNSHGVTIGPGNTFDDIASGAIEGWKVNRLPAMLRPNWTEEERQQKVSQYGSEDSVDYRRNVLGLSGNSGVNLVVLHRLMSNVDTDVDSDYNQEYYNCKFDDAQVREVDDVVDLVDPPIGHRNYKNIWMGMDFGLTTSASCITIFAETKDKADAHSRLTMIGKITMVRVSTEDQVKVVMHLMELYRPISFAFDAHGFGQAAFDWLQKEVRSNPETAWMLERVKGYSFSKKMIVGFDDNIEIHEADPEGWKEAAIEKLGAEASLDSLRFVVDTKRVKFPFDKPMLAEIQAVPRHEKPLLDEYGKTKRKSGQHTLDALRFTFLAYTQKDIDEIIASYEVRLWEAPDMIIVDEFY